ncbi:calcium-binding protein [Litoreibacter albidus]|uniref:Hemolysin-type calcium-binding repeat-containing protein n=1 Tax=Litoreibacter albidus TaxID=670155 RepID=A0A1H2V9Y1_9RHOB|nr:calcium-binding protein [Litoreibacter albidus]SDW64714.1 Hemolysin-type calcium-binding repeat-containing protein [Litoreibacter albidus]
MSVLTVFGSDAADVFNPDVFDFNYTEYRIYANGGDDVITVTDNTPTTIDGGDGNDRLILSGGNDTISGGLGNDYILAGGGDDVVNAGNGDDRVFGGTGADVLNGAGGNDYIDGGHGADVIDGGSGDDFIFGRKGNNDLFGGAGNDTVNTGDHTSRADGGTGNDLIVARLKKGADHTLTGGADADVFEFVYQSAKKSSDVTITDFELGLDDFIVAGLNGQDWVDANFAFADIFGVDLLTEVDGNAVLDIGFKDTITFEGVSEAAFTAFYLDDPIAVG